MYIPHSSYTYSNFSIHKTNMKFSIVAALVALSAASVSAAGDYTFSGTVYAYLNDMDHPKTSFLKKGSGKQVLTNGAGCKGSKLLPGTGDSISGTFTAVKNQWDFNGKHDNEIAMGYIKVGNQCLTITKGNPLSLDTCPSFDEEIKAGNKFAWFHDHRNSAIWAYGGDANAVEHNGVNFATANLQTKGKTLKGTSMREDPLKNTFLGLGHVSLGHAAHSPRGCE
ncbi:hypothetical protein BCR42DRAFT_493997 [Absidia repens]|uniref:Uncharacterized protein n=1 Tax=Absidia repens TaxID=90262 RepID=A0A1X2I854_9FUNG|nr:hypothetical protein BCR42DRAFT_493997 [Absidia repens]